MRNWRVSCSRDAKRRRLLLFTNISSVTAQTKKKTSRVSVQLEIQRLSALNTFDKPQPCIENRATIYLGNTLREALFTLLRQVDPRVPAGLGPQIPTLTAWKK